MRTERVKKVRVIMRVHHHPLLAADHGQPERRAFTVLAVINSQMNGEQAAHKPTKPYVDTILDRVEKTSVLSRP